MHVKIAKWGNSGCPKPLLEMSGLSDNDEVEIVAENERLIIRSARERPTLEKIFHSWDGGIPDTYDWGELDAPKGREAL